MAPKVPGAITGGCEAETELCDEDERQGYVRCAVDRIGVGGEPDEHVQDCQDGHPELPGNLVPLDEPVEPLSHGDLLS
jgi:hypothetical protein